MSNEATIGELAIGLKLRVEALEKAAKIAEKRLKEIENENKNLVNSNKEVDASWIALGVTAVLTFNKIIGVVKDATEEYKAHTQSMEALRNVASYTKNDMQDFTAIMNKYEGILEQTDLADTIKNFSLMGFTVEQTDQMIQALTNSAIRNRNANYTVSQAVKVASDGYKQGLSTLSDSAGVTENLSVMLDNHAKSLGKTASQLTETEKNQAYLNRTMLAAEPFAGAMEGYLDSLAGKQGEYSQAMRETKIAYAEALETTLIAMTEIKTKLVNVLGNLITENKEAVAGISIFGVTLLGTIGIISAGIKIIDTMKKSVDALNISTKALKATFIATFAISAVVGAISAVTTKLEEQREAQSKLNEITEKYNQIQNGTFEYSDENIAEMEANRKAISDQISLLKGMEAIQNHLNETVIAVPHGIIYTEGKEEAKRLEEELKSYQKALEDCRKENGSFGNSFDELNQKLKETNLWLNNASSIQKIKSAIDTDAVKTQQQEAAQLRINVDEMQNYLDIIKKRK